MIHLNKIKSTLLYTVCTKHDTGLGSALYKTVKSYRFIPDCFSLYTVTFHIIFLYMKTWHANDGKWDWVWRIRSSDLHVHNSTCLFVYVSVDISVKKEVPSPGKPCSFDQRMKGIVYLYHAVYMLYRVFLFVMYRCVWGCQCTPVSVLSVWQNFNIVIHAPTVIDGALMPPMLPLVKREEVTPMEVSSNLPSAGVFKVKALQMHSSALAVIMPH